MNAAFRTEAERQRDFLRALHGGSLPGLQGQSGEGTRGFAAYRAHAGAAAERALAAAFPTVAALVGADGFGMLARHFWHEQPPERGDLGEWGAGLPAFIADNPRLADEPYLADSARLDWAVHRAARARDEPAEVQGLLRLGERPAHGLRLRLRAGSALLASHWPVVALRAAHERGADPDAFAPVRAAFATGSGEHALVWRCGWRVGVAALPEADAVFTRALLDGRSLAAALDAAGDGFVFEPWLLTHVHDGLLAAVDLVDERTV